MLGRYFVIALRRTFQDKIFSLINLIGLSVGMASVILIVVFVFLELNVDRFHKNSDRIFRVLRETKSLAGAPQVSPGTSGLLAQSLRADVPEIENVTRFFVAKKIGQLTRRMDFLLMFVLLIAIFFRCFLFRSRWVIQKPL